MSRASCVPPPTRPRVRSTPSDASLPTSTVMLLSGCAWLRCKLGCRRGVLRDTSRCSSRAPCFDARRRQGARVAPAAAGCQAPALGLAGLHCLRATRDTALVVTVTGAGEAAHGLQGALARPRGGRGHQRRSRPHRDAMHSACRVRTTSASGRRLNYGARLVPAHVYGRLNAVPPLAQAPSSPAGRFAQRGGQAGRAARELERLARTLVRSRRCCSRHRGPTTRAHSAPAGRRLEADRPPYAPSAPRAPALPQASWAPLAR